MISPCPLWKTTTLLLFCLFVGTSPETWSPDTWRSLSRGTFKDFRSKPNV